MLASCALQSKSAAEAIYNFSNRKVQRRIVTLSQLCSLKVLNGKKIHDLRTLARSALQVSMASRAVGELHQSSTTPRRVLRVAGRKFVPGNGKLVPSCKRKSCSDDISATATQMKQAKVDDMIDLFSLCRLSGKDSLDKALSTDAGKSLVEVERKLEACKLESSPHTSQEPRQQVASTHIVNKVIPSHTVPCPSLPAHGDESVGTGNKFPAVTAESSSDTEASATTSDTSSASSNDGSQSLGSRKKSMWLRQPPSLETQLKKKKVSAKPKKTKKTKVSRSQFQDVSASKQTLLRNFFSTQTKEQGDQAQVDHE